MKNVNHFKPVAVSHIAPVYHNGHVRFWDLHVDFEGKLTPVQVCFLPEFQHIMDFGEYKKARNTTVLKYRWQDGLFGNGFERIWQFRINMLSQITTEHIKQRQLNRLKTR